MSRVKRMDPIEVPQVEQRRFRLFVLAVALFLVAAPLLLWYLGQFSVRAYFVVSLLWVLISSEIFAPENPDTTWWTRLQWIKLVGVLVLAYIVFERAMAVV